MQSPSNLDKQLKPIDSTKGTRQALPAFEKLPLKTKERLILADGAEQGKIAIQKTIPQVVTTSIPTKTEIQMNTRFSIPNQFLALIGWLLLCFAAAGSAVFVSVDGWYAALNKPSWNPPASLFGPAWTILYTLMAVAAWLVWREGGWSVRGKILGLFLAQLLLNALWTPLFFGLHWMDVAFAEILILWVMIALTMKAFWKVKPAAGLLLLPYLAWVSFAAVLNFTIWRMNA